MAPGAAALSLSFRGRRIDANAAQRGEVRGQLRDLFERIHRDMPPDKRDTLIRQRAADLVAFLLSFNRLAAARFRIAGSTD